AEAVVAQIAFQQFADAAVVIHYKNMGGVIGKRCCTAFPVDDGFLSSQILPPLGVIRSDGGAPSIPALVLALRVCRDEPLDLRPVILVDQREKDSAPGGGGLRPRLFQRCSHAGALGCGKALFEFEARLCEIEEPLAAILLAGLLLDEAALDELFQHTG